MMGVNRTGCSGVCFFTDAPLCILSEAAVGLVPDRAGHRRGWARHSVGLVLGCAGRDRPDWQKSAVPRARMTPRAVGRNFPPPDRAHDSSLVSGSLHRDDPMSLDGVVFVVALA